MNLAATITKHVGSLLALAVLIVTVAEGVNWVVVARGPK